MVSSVVLPFLLRYSELIPIEDAPAQGCDQLVSAPKERVGVTRKTSVGHETTDDD
jgi:hypothetical protein